MIYREALACLTWLSLAIACGSWAVAFMAADDPGGALLAAVGAIALSGAVANGKEWKRLRGLRQTEVFWQMNRRSRL
jgi:hypothetical protein